MSGAVLLRASALLPLALSPDAPGVMHAPTELRRGLAGLGAALVRAGLPVRRPDQNDTPGVLIEECLKAQLARYSTRELSIVAGTVNQLGCDEDYTMGAEDGEDDGIDESAVVIAAYQNGWGVISFSALRAVLDAFEGGAGHGAAPIPLGLALHVACEQALGAALRICGPVYAMELKTYDGMFDAREEYESIRDDLARERITQRDRDKGVSRYQLPQAEVDAEVKAVSNQMVDEYIAQSSMLTLQKMYDFYGVSRLGQYEAVTLTDLRSILGQARQRGLPPAVAETVDGWIGALLTLQDEAGTIQLRLRALSSAGNLLGRLIYGFRPPTLVLDVRGPGEDPEAERVGSLQERIEERAEGEAQNPDPEVPLAAALLTSDTAADVLAVFADLGALEQRAGALFRQLSAWGEAALACQAAQPAA